MKMHKNHKHKVKKYRDYSLISTPRWVWVLEDGDKYWYYASEINNSNVGEWVWIQSDTDPTYGNRMLEEEENLEIDLEDLPEGIEADPNSNDTEESDSGGGDSGGSDSGD